MAGNIKALLSIYRAAAIAHERIVGDAELEEETTEANSMRPGRNKSGSRTHRFHLTD